MLLSQFFLPTLKETPADAQLVSHQLMLRAGMIRQLASGLYTWLPLGVRVLRKVEAIVRQEMDKVGALELLMPVVQPANLWQESGRWDQYGFELLKFADRQENAFCLGPTHEEIICHTMRKELRSYKQLPLNVYQIQIKFRDEIRPRFGVMRSREFIMKDAYSFHLTEQCLQQTYEKMFAAYTAIFTRLGLNFRAVLADTGAIGGDYSHEFQVLADSGEDTVVYSDGSDYAANIERATALVSSHEHPPPGAELEKMATPGVRTMADLQQKFNIEPSCGIKTLIVKGVDHPLVALILRGDHELNEIKAAHLAEVVSPLELVDEGIIFKTMGVGCGSVGPVNLNIPYIVDHSAAALADFVCGANEDGFHHKNVNWGRDAALDRVADLRNVQAGDLSPDGKGTLHFKRGIEVGQLFQLGDKYSKSMNLTVLNQAGKTERLHMGCYGIGITRTVAAAIEQHHDKHGIIWSPAMAPFDVAIIPVQMHKSYRVRELAEQLYQQFEQAGFSVLMDDRKERPGAMFATMDLIGVPHQIIIGERGIDQQAVEYKSRTGEGAEFWPIDEVLSRLSCLLNDNGSHQD